METGRLLKELVFNDLLENALKLIWCILGVGSSCTTGNENVMKQEESTIKRKRTPCRLKTKYKKKNQTDNTSPSSKRRRTDKKNINTLQIKLQTGDSEHSHNVMNTL